MPRAYEEGPRGRRPKETDANDLLKKLIGDLENGTLLHRAKPATFDDLLELVRARWLQKRRKSRLLGDRGKETARVRRLRKSFGRFEAQEITELHLDRYFSERMAEGAARSTIRNELGILKHGMTLAVEKALLQRRPKFPEIELDEARQGFFERCDVDRLLSELPEHLRGAVTFMFCTGWRSKTEVFSRAWHHVDLASGKIRLDAGETKNNKPRTYAFGLNPELKAVIEAQRRYTDEVQRRTGRVIRWVFHNEGVPFTGTEEKRFYREWHAACERAGVPGRIPHDLRRTVARNLVKLAGVDEQTAMKITGHKTRSVFTRYNITVAKDEEDAVAKLAAAVPPTAPDRSVVPLLDPSRTQKAAGQ